MFRAIFEQSPPALFLRHPLAQYCWSELFVRFIARSGRLWTLFQKSAVFK